MYAYQRSPHNIRNCFGGQNMRLYGVVAVLPLLPALTEFPVSAGFFYTTYRHAPDVSRTL